MRKNESKLKVMWDLCSGLGGASEAFLVAGWLVIRIEIEDMLQWVPHTRQLDVLQWREWVNDLVLEHGVPDFILGISPHVLNSRQHSTRPGRYGNVKTPTANGRLKWTFYSPSKIYLPK